MKILFISIPSIHAIRWIENLKGSGHDLYWFDVLDQGAFKAPPFVTQFTSWKNRKRPYIKGEYFLRKKLPSIYFKIQTYLETTVDEQLEKIINEIKPDVIHSFEMQSGSYPLLKTMLKYPNLNWVYSCWGNDLFYYQKINKHRKKIEKVLERINFLHTDCLRDYEIAKKLNFKGEYLGVIPGGGGFKLAEFEKLKSPLEHRNIILVKGYEHKFGRALNVLKALELVLDQLSQYKIIVFGAHKKVINYVNENKLPFKVYDRDELSHAKMISLMGESKIYIGNSISDGMPNTLLEAIVMDVFPIQSNPGGVSAEIIDNEQNGLLIDNPSDIDEIKTQVLKAIEFDKEGKFIESIEINKRIVNQRLDYITNQQKIVALYQKIENSSHE